jgi:hypothetical protein
MATIVDLNIAKNGEVASKLQRLINEIDILLSTGRNLLVTNFNANCDLDEYLFKSGISATVVSNHVKDIIVNNVSKTDIFIDVDASFLNGKAVKDILFIDVTLTLDDTSSSKRYIIQ